jgi:hypothetical protein
MANPIKLIVLLSIPFLMGATWYVRPSGGSYGSENGTSYANAWDGFTNINWASISADDTLYICGAHTTEVLTIGADGTLINQLTVSGGCSGDAGSISNSNPPITPIATRKYIDLKDISLSSNSSSRVLTVGSNGTDLTPTTKVRLFNVSINGAGGGSTCLRYISTDGIIYGGTYINCVHGGLQAFNSPGIEIAHLTLGNNGTSGTGNFDAIGVDDGCYGPIVHDNYIYSTLGSGGSGIDMQNSFTSTTNGRIFRNLVVNGEGSGITAGGNESNIVYDNIASNNAGQNFNSHSSSASILQKFYNNTSTGSTLYNLKVGFTADSAQMVEANNNIFSATASQSEVFLNNPATVFTESNNLYLSTASNFQTYDAGVVNHTKAEWTGLGYLTNAVFADPKFTGSADFHLQQSSPAINAGTYLPEVSTDYDGNPRVGITDIGAFESQWQLKSNGAKFKGLRTK